MLHSLLDVDIEDRVDELAKNKYKLGSLFSPWYYYITNINGEDIYDFSKVNMGDFFHVDKLKEDVNEIGWWKDDELMELLNTFPNDYIRDFLNNICHLISNTYIGQSEMYNKLQTFDTDTTFRDVFGDPRLDDIIKGYIKDEFTCNIKSHIYPNTYENYGFNYTYTISIHIVGYLNIIIKFMSKE
jgi:hypothetical protein